MVLATKWNKPQTAVAVEEAFTKSLERLQTDYVDLYQYHSFDSETPLEETLGSLQSQIERGRVRAPACCNYNGEQLTMTVNFQRGHGWPVMASVQPMYNLVRRDIEQMLLPVCKELDVGVMSYSPLAAGFLTGKYGKGDVIPAGSRFDIKPGHKRHYFSEQGFAMVEKIRTVAEKLGVPPPRLAIAWVMSRPLVTTVLCGARSTDHIDQAIAARKLADEMGPERLDAELL